VTKYLWAVVLVGGCVASDPVGGSTGDSGDLDDSCRAASREEDFAVDGDLGPQGDPANWGELPPDAIVSTTYLRMLATPEAQQAFGEATGPVAAELSAPAAGLMGLSFASSEACGTVRTLSVWATEEDQIAFVTGPAHGAAMTRIGDISRGGSVTMSWSVSELGEVSWEAVVDALQDHDGPSY
jgi:hypothetical protein